MIVPHGILVTSGGGAGDGARTSSLPLSHCRRASRDQPPRRPLRTRRRRLRVRGRLPRRSWIRRKGAAGDAGTRPHRPPRAVSDPDAMRALCFGGSVEACLQSRWKSSGACATLGAGSSQTRSSPSTHGTLRSCRPRARCSARSIGATRGSAATSASSAAAFEVPSFEVEELIDAGACVVEIVQVSARRRHSGAEVRRRIASVYSFRAGVVFKHVIYLDRAEALAAAGLPLRPTGQPRSGPTETA
jgi:hypothetical protein